MKSQKSTNSPAVNLVPLPKIQTRSYLRHSPDRPQPVERVSGQTPTPPPKCKRYTKVSHCYEKGRLTANKLKSKAEQYHAMSTIQDNLNEASKRLEVDGVDSRC